MACPAYLLLLLAAASSTELTNVNGRAALQGRLQNTVLPTRGQQGHTATPLLSWQHAGAVFSVIEY